MNAAQKRDAAPVITLPWRASEAAFSSLSDRPGSLLLHGGGQVSRIYAFPEKTISRDVERGDYPGIAAELRDALAGGGQWAGLFSYEFASAFEHVPRAAPSQWRDINLGLYPAWAVFDGGAQTVEVFGQKNAAQHLADAFGELKACPAPSPQTRASWTERWSAQRYQASCSHIIEHIAAGDIYQANLSQGFDVALAQGDTPYAAFLRLLGQSPAPYGGYFCLDENQAVLTNSPELFLKLKGGIAQSAPIKGTRPRGTTTKSDSAQVDALLASEKDRAENLMIVDLVRHDLSRVCVPGSVEVPELCAPHAYANVHHLVSTVRGEIRETVDAFDLLAAAFPPGSITGTPKIRAMEIIAEQEGEARGPYCGAMGWIGAGGQSMELNVMIRTAALTRSGASWHAAIRSGGAITIGSDPVSEFEETLAKASALRAAF